MMSSVVSWLEIMAHFLNNLNWNLSLSLLIPFYECFKRLRELELDVISSGMSAQLIIWLPHASVVEIIIQDNDSDIHIKSLFSSLERDISGLFPLLRIEF